MDFATLDRSLPKGFHDAVLKGIALDLLGGSISFTLDLWVGDDLIREKSQSAIFTVDGLVLLHFDKTLIGKFADPLTIDIGSGQPATAPIELQIDLRGTELIWIFMHETNSFIRLAGKQFSIFFKE